MTNRGKKILAEALNLSPAERAVLAEEILSSIDLPANKELYDAWCKEVEERIDAYEQNKLNSIPAADVFKRIDH